MELIKMNVFERTFLSEIAFAAMIGDIEQGDGLIIFPAGGPVIKCVLKFIGHTADGQPAAVYVAPGQEGYALVVADSLQRSPYISKWMTEDEMRTVVPTIGGDGRRHDKKARRRAFAKV
jgi:hypothetical protein